MRVGGGVIFWVWFYVISSAAITIGIPIALYVLLRDDMRPLPGEPPWKDKGDSNDGKR